MQFVRANSKIKRPSALRVTSRLSKPAASMARPSASRSAVATQKKVVSLGSVQLRSFATSAPNTFSNPHVNVNNNSRQLMQSKMFRMQKSGISQVLNRNTQLFGRHQLASRPTSSGQRALHSRGAKSFPVVRKRNLAAKHPRSFKNAIDFSPLLHIEKFLSAPKESFTSKKYKSPEEFMAQTGGVNLETPSLGDTLRSQIESPETRIPEDDSVVTSARQLMKIAEEEIDALKESVDVDEPEWEQCQKWLDLTDFTFLHQEENFAVLILKEEGELPAVRVSWDPTFRPSYDESQSIEDEEYEEEEMGGEEGEVEEDVPQTDQPLEIQIRNPNKVEGGQLVIKAVVGPEDKFYLEEFWCGPGSNLSLDTWLSGKDVERLNFVAIEDFSTDLRHAVYDYLDSVGISDNVSRFVATHTRINRNSKQRDMMVRLMQFMEPIQDQAQRVEAETKKEKAK